MSKLIHGDCAKELTRLPANSVDLLVTDPPYGYSFMGKNWDRAVPSTEIWKECLRVLKPGAFALIMSAPRSDVLSRMICRIEDVGFRVDFTPIYWTYASGFPKAMNIAKAVDRRFGTGKRGAFKRSVPDMRGNNYGQDKHAYGGDTVDSFEHVAEHPEAVRLDGSYGGFQPKPAVEVIIVAMKPLSERTFVDQALKNRRGVTWLDDCRVPINDDTGVWGTSNKTTNPDRKFCGSEGKEDYRSEQHSNGRFPANLLVSDDVLNDGRITKSTDRPRHNNRPKTEAYGVYNPDVTGGHSDSGSYSRYFDLDAWWAKTLPLLIVPKASKREKSTGVENLKGYLHSTGARTYDDICATCGRKFFGDSPYRCECAVKVTQRRETQGNFHPTVKPLKLMSYLITLGSREGDVVLEPFAGSGTTCVAAKMLNRNFIGIEREREYVEIAKARLKASPPVQPSLIAAE